jgi:hypothetical protein
VLENKVSDVRCRKWCNGHARVSSEMTSAILWSMGSGRSESQREAERGRYSD